MTVMLDDTLKLIATWRTRTPAASLPTELVELFTALAADPPVDGAYAVEDRIWELWIDHPDPAAARRMNEAIAGIARRHYDAAGAVLDALVADLPDWAEAWNKRATLRFLEERDSDSIADIRRTLELEPRHFGAMSGFAQICLRQSRPDAALFALEAALEINPHLNAARTALNALRSRRPETLH